ncbi:MAG: uncharacterized protein H6Q04_1815 [Acidobacteria bacterium]|jgi:sugar phosphate isomerase/epimerase|nr:uncharacterized protein [Acidobacteriota bacterium]
MPYIFHAHCKFWNVTDELTDESIPFEEIIPVLIQGGYDGYVSSEYSGPRYLFRASDQLWLQHAMLKRLLGESEEPAI